VASLKKRSGVYYAQWYVGPKQKRISPDTESYQLAKEKLRQLESSLAREQVRTADLVANPGCYPTAAALALVPLLRAGLIQRDSIIINAASGGRQVPLPTDQIVFADDTSGSARVGFGGMSFEGMGESHLVFYRVRDLRPEEELSPERGRKMTLEPHMVSSIYVDGRHVWPAGSSSSDSIPADGRR